MKILFLTEFYPTSLAAEVRGGVEQRTFQLSQLVASTHEVVVVACRETSQAIDSHVGAVHVRRPGPSSSYQQSGHLLNRLRFVLSARREVLRLNPEVVILENFLAYAIGLTLPPKLRRRSFVTYHDVWLGQYIRHLGWFTGLAGEVVERLTLRTRWRGIIANSKFTAANVQRHLKSTTPVSVVYNGIHVDDYRTSPAEAFNVPTIVTVARLVAYKRIGDLLQALGMIRRSVRLARLVVIGSGPQERILKQQAADLGLSQAIEWRGFVLNHRDVVAAVKGATIFCLPSAVEGYGIVTLEAMAAGTPYVSSDIPATREVTAGGRGGKLYPVGQVEALSASAIELLSNQAERQACAQAGLQRAADFDWSVVGRNLLDVLKTTVEI